MDLWTTLLKEKKMQENKGKNTSLHTVDKQAFYCGKKCGRIVDLWKRKQNIPTLKMYK